MSGKYRFQAIVLAAGLSRRMGKANKLLLPFGTHSILEEVLHQLLGSGLENTIVVTGHERTAVTARLQNHAVQAVFNPDYAQGQGSSIRAGVQALAAETDAFLILLGDMPHLKTKHYQSLLQAFEDLLEKRQQPILRPFRGNTPGHPVVFHRHYRTALLASEDAESARPVIQQYREHLVRWPTKEPAFFADIDTPAAYRKLKL